MKVFNFKTKDTKENYLHLAVRTNNDNIIK